MPGSPESRTTWPSPLLGLLPEAEQELQLPLAADERREPGRAQGLEAALGPPLAEHPPGPHRCGEALEAALAQVGALEQAADQPARAPRDHHRARRCQRLQPRREVRRLADDDLLPRRALADQLAHDHQASGDADPRHQTARRRGC